MRILLNKNIFDQHQRIAFAVALLVLLGALLIVLLYYGGFGRAKRVLWGGERTISETPSPRTLSQVRASDSRLALSSGEEVYLVSREQVLIEQGKTLKEGYALALPEGEQWSPDAKLVYVRSLGTVTTLGVSSGWEVAFGSAVKKKGYVVSIVRGAVTDKKEVASSSFGYSLPKEWYDAGEAIRSIQTLPQFRDATISGINFYYNEDGKRWGYAISSSNGTVSIPVR